jgi:hypothetical protein
VTLFLIGVLVLAIWGSVCFWLAVRYRRQCVARGIRVDHNVLATMIVAGTSCLMMAFYLLFTTFNPPPAAMMQPLER